MTGVLYLLMGIAAAFNLQYPTLRFLVRGDPAATARAIASSELAYRVTVFTGLFAAVAFLLLAHSLVELFRDVDATQARLLAMFVITASSATVAMLPLQLAPLVVLRGARPDVGLAMTFLRVHSVSNDFVSMFWGLWLLPFGALVLKSRFIPRILGWFLLAGGLAYAIVSTVSIVFPDHRRVAVQFATPLFALAELPITLWFLFTRSVHASPTHD